MVKSFAYQFSRGQQDTWLIWLQRVEFCYQCCAQFFRHSPVQHKKRRNLIDQCCLDCIKMFGALGEYKHLSSLAKSVLDLSANRRCALFISSKLAEYILNSGFLRQINSFVKHLRNNFQIVGGTLGFGSLVANRAALHENDWLLTVAADWRSGQAENVFRFDPFQDRIE